MKNPIVLLIACVTGLTSFQLGAQTRVPPERAAAAREALNAWFECVECTDGELEALARYAPDVESTLVQTARSGLSPAKKAMIEQELHAEFQANRWNAQENSQEEQNYVATYLQNAEIAYRVRSIKAIAAIPIGTPAARQAVEDARGDASPLVRAAAHEASDLLRRIPPR